MKQRIAVLMAIVATSGLSTFEAEAQSVNKARVFSAREMKGLQWPRMKAESRGSFEAQSAALQYLLRRQGFYKGKPDGVFGARTTNRVRAFQRAKGLKVDGVVGPQTWPKLLIRLKRGDRGDAVRALQIMLRSQMDHDGGTPFLNVEVDGVFGAETEKVVRSYQSEWVNNDMRPTRTPVKVDGIVGPRTWWTLFGGDFQD